MKFFYLVDPNFVEINELTTDKDQLEVFPNPNNGEFTIILPNGYSEFKIYNGIGETVKTNILNTSSNHQKFQLSNIPKGVYFITAFENNRIVSKKIIIQ